MFLCIICLYVVKSEGKACDCVELFLLRSTKIKFTAEKYFLNPTGWTCMYLSTR